MGIEHLSNHSTLDTILNFDSSYVGGLLGLSSYFSEPLTYSLFSYSFYLFSGFYSIGLIF